MKIDSEGLFRQHGKWYAALRWKDETGTWHRKTKACKSKEKYLAKYELQEWRREVEAEELKGQSRTLADIVEAWFEVESSAGSIEPSTVIGYRSIVRRITRSALGGLCASDITHGQAQDWVIELTDSGLSPSTIKKTIGVASRATESAIASGELSVNPFRGLRKPKLTTPRPNSLDAKGRATVQAWIASGEPTRLRIAAALALHGGLRLGECCGLKWDDIELPSCTLWVRRAIGDSGGKTYEKLPKSGKPRDVPLDDFMVDLLRRWKETQSAEAKHLKVSAGAYVIGTPNGYTSPDTISRRWAVVARELNLIGTEGKIINFHGLRHTFATVAVASGVDIKTVSSILGHANAAMTLNVYASADPDAKRAAAVVIGNALRKKAPTRHC